MLYAFASDIPDGLSRGPTSPTRPGPRRPTHPERLGRRELLERARAVAPIAEVKAVASDERRRVASGPGRTGGV